MIKLEFKEESDFFDELIQVTDLGDGTVQVIDNREEIKFIHPIGPVNFDVTKDPSFDDEFYFDKIQAQNDDVGIDDRKDSFYVSCLCDQLTRIFEHLDSNYKGF